MRKFYPYNLGTYTNDKVKLRLMLRNCPKVSELRDAERVLNSEN
jgi:hypothetical protein